MKPSHRIPPRALVLAGAVLLALQAVAGTHPAPAGDIAVTVTDATPAPLENIGVQILDAGGGGVAFQWTDASGQTTFSGLPPGTYWARTSNSAGYIDEFFDDVPAIGHEIADGTPITVTDGGTEVVSFQLEEGGHITGRVTDASTTNGIANVWVDVFDAAGRQIGSSNATDANGDYSVPFGLPTGDYYLSTNNNESYVNELYDGRQSWSRVMDGTPVAVTKGDTVTGIDFALDVGARIQGTVTGPGGVPIEGAWINVMDASGRGRTGGGTAADGTYTTGVVPTGSYYVGVGAGGAYISELYNNVTCLNCGTTGGTAIAVTAPANTTGIDFELAIGGQVSGRITDADTTSGVAGVWVEIFDTTGRHVGGSPQSDTDGNFTTQFGLPTGTYIARTNSNVGYVNEAYDDVSISASWSSYTPFTVTAGETTTGIDFELEPGGQIAGRVFDAETGFPVAWHGGVGIYDTSGRWVSGSGLDASGYYMSGGLPAGDYYVTVGSSAGHVAQIYPGVTCLNCGITGGTPVAVTAGAIVRGVDFWLARGGIIAGTITDAVTSNPIAGVWVDVFDSTGRHVGSSPPSDASGHYVTEFGLPTGSYNAHTSNSGAFINEAYDNLPINTSAANRTPIAVVAGATTPNIDFQLSEGGRIAGRVVDSDTLEPLAGVGVSFFDATGQGVGGVGTNSDGSYMSSGLPTGTYYAKTERFGAYIMTLYAGVPFIYGDVRTGMPVAVTAGSTTGSIDFALVKGGQIAGHVTAEAGGAPLAGIGINVADAGGTFLWGQESPTDATGAYITTGLPAGTYYIRTEGNHAYVNEFYNDLPYGTNPTSATPVVVTPGAVTPDIDFQLAAGGRIAGQVIDAVTLEPVPNVGVSFYDASGQGVGGVGTDGGGYYLSSGLPAGTYYAKTERSGAYIQELYGGTHFLRGDATTGAPITVAAGTTTSDIDFALDVGGQIAGLITNEAGGAPLAGVSVEIFDASGSSIWGWDGPTDATGAYITTGLPAGTYYIRTNGGHGFVNEFYDNLPVGSNPTDTTAVVVSLGSVTPGVNFQLAAGGFIAGSVLADGGGVVPGAGVSFFDGSGRYLGGTGTSASGAYVSPALPAGSHFVSTGNNGGYINEVYDNIPCIRCAVTSGSPVPVAAGATTAGINFVLAPGGRISGRVTNAAGGAGIPGVWVDIHDAAGNHLGSSPGTDAGGYYTTQFGLLTGTYYASTNNNGAFVNEAYDNLPINTSATNRTPIAVVAGATTPNIDFQLSEGGRIAGHVEDAGTHLPLANVSVSVFGASGDYVGGANTDSSGNYVSPGLAAGTYYAKTERYGAYIMTLYAGIPFIQGDVRTGTPITVTVGATTGSIDFALVKGGQIAGHITAAAGGAPLANINVQVADSSGTFIWGWEDATDATGAYITTGLPAGTYYIRTVGNHAYVNEFYDNMPYWTSPTSATPVTVTLGSVTPNIDFQLSEGGHIAGHIEDAVTHLPLGNAPLSFFDASGQYVGGTGSDSAGNYVSPGLAAGTYYAKTERYGAYIMTLYAGIPFIQGDVRTGTPITVTAGATTNSIDFALVKGGQIAGHITAAAGGAPLANINVQVADSSGTFIWGWEDATDATGAYITTGLPAGTYYIRTEGTHAYANEFYDNMPYWTSPTSATPVTVTLGSVTPNIDFTLALGGRIAGTVTDAGTGLPLAGVQFSVVASNGSWLGGWEPASGADGAYVTRALPPGTYYIRTEGTHGYVNEFYNDFPYWAAPTGTTPVIVTAGAVTPSVNFALARGGQISGKVTAGVGGAGVSNVFINVKNASNQTVASGRSDSLGNFITSAMAAGTYYAYTSNPGGYFISQIYDRAPCCNVSSGTPISVTVGATTPNIDFPLETGGKIAGTITNNATGLGVANASVVILNSSGVQAASTGNTGSAGQYSSVNLPAGTYFARTQNSSGYTNEFYDNLPIWTPTLSATPIAVTAGATTTANFGLDVNPGPNMPATAQEVPIGLTENLVFTAGLAPDVQWYKVYIPPEEAGKDLKVNLRVTSPYPDPIPSGWGSDLDFEVLDGDLKVRAIAVSSSDNETVYLHDVASGWYYVYMGYCSTNYADSSVSVRYAIDIQTGSAADFGLGYISGRIVDSNGQGVEQVYVRASGVPGDWAVSFPTVTAGAGGYFTVPWLPGYRSLYITGDGTASPNQAAINVVEEFYSDKPTQGLADTLIIRQGETTNVGNITLAIGAIVTGQVTNTSGQPLLNARLYAFDLAGYARATTLTDSGGNYTLIGVPPGGAKMRFSRTNYALEFYDNQPTFGTGGILATQGGMTISNVNAVLTAGGRITGTLQDTSGAPVSANVRLYSVSDSTYSRASVTPPANTGAFTINNVMPGQYKLQFAPWSIGFVEEWHDNAASFADAAVITVTEGGTVSGILAVLEPASPEIDVAQDETPIASGDLYAFGSRVLGSDTDVIFTIANPGTGGLTIGAFPLVVSGADAYEFEVVSQPAFPVAPGGSTTFTVRFHPTSPGAKSAYVSIPTNDADESPYVINLAGTAITEKLVPVITWPAPAPIVVGTPLSVLQLNATADVPGTFAYTPDFGTVLPVGTHTLSTVFTPADTATYSSTAAQVPLTVLPLENLAVPYDFTGDLTSDILWRGTVGDLWLWGMENAAHATDGYVGTVGDANWEIRGQGDLNGDGMADLLWRHKTAGTIYYWQMNGHVPVAELYVSTVDTAYDIVGTKDFDGDGKADILWRNPAIGDLWLWRMNGAEVLGQQYVDTVDLSYAIRGLGDVNGDLKADVVWQGAAGDVWAWLMNGAVRTFQGYVGTVADGTYQIQQVADFDADLKADLLWRNTVAGDLWVWRLDGASKLSEHYVGIVADTNYQIQAAGDYNEDGMADLLWRHSVGGDLWIWQMNGPAKASEHYVGLVADQGYQIVR